MDDGKQMRWTVTRASSRGWLCVLLFMIQGCLIKRPMQPIQGEIVKSIRFEGNSGTFGDVPDSALREAMEQQQSAGMWWLDPAERAATLDRKALAKDAWRIETFYANNGYFDARVRGWDVITLREGNPEKQRPRVVEIVGYVSERKPSIVKEIDWEGLGKLKYSKGFKSGRHNIFYTLLRKQAAIQVGDRFVVEALREVEDQTLNKLHDQSYAFASVESRVDAHPEDKSVKVELTVDLGPSSQFGEVTIEGEYGIPKEMVLEQVSIKKGRRFSAATLAETQRQLFALGVFSVVNVVPDLSKRDAGVVPVRIELAESDYRSLKIGGGFLLENGKQDLHGTLGFEHVNVFNRLWNLSAAARPGYAWITTLSEVVGEEDAAEESVEQSPTADVDLTLTIPHFPTGSMELLNDVGMEYGVEEGYTYFSPEVGPTLSWQLNDYMSLAMGYRLKFFKYFDLEADASLGRGRFGLNFTNPYLLSSLHQQLIWNSRDNVFFPEEGQYIVLGLKEAGGPMGGGFNYLHPDFDIRVFDTIRKMLGHRTRLTTATRIAGGFMFPYETGLNPDGRDEVPFAERRMMGGSSSVRGWVRNHLGPYVCDAETYEGDLNLGSPGDALLCAGRLGRPQETSAITPIGGTAYLNTTLELRQYFANDAGVVLFNDWGMVWNELNDVSPLHLVPSAGLGLRYKSPIGAIRFDAAYRFDTEPMFTLEPPYQLHFGLSEAF